MFLFADGNDGQDMLSLLGQLEVTFSGSLCVRQISCEEHFLPQRDLRNSLISLPRLSVLSRHRQIAKAGELCWSHSQGFFLRGPGRHSRGGESLTQQAVGPGVLVAAAA